METKAKRLSVELSDELHHKIKTYALKRNITVRKYVVRALINLIKWEEKYSNEELREEM